MKKYIVSIGGFSHEGLVTNVKALGYDFVSIKLDKVLPITWLKRVDLLDELIKNKEISASIIYLHTSLLLKASEQDYFNEFSEILKRVTKSRTIIFIYQDNLDGIFSPRHKDTNLPFTIDELENLREEQKNQYFKPYEERFSFSREELNNTMHYENFYLDNNIKRLKEYENRKDEVENLIKLIYDSGAEIAPFYVRSDVTIRLQEFLNDVEQKVFLKLFISNDRFQAEQLKSLLSVLERYLRQVEGQDFSIDSMKSNNGVVYIFRADSGGSLQDLNNAFNRFDSFMKLCGDQPEQAKQILIQQGISEKESLLLVHQYLKEYKRLIIDSKHEFEMKTLLLKQKFESDTVELGDKVKLDENFNLSNIIANTAMGNPITINVSNLSVTNAQEIRYEVEKIINGIEINENDEKLLELLSKYSEGLEALQCRSDLEQLKDSTLPEPERKNAKQRLISFLKKAARKTIDIAEKAAIESLSIYIGSLITSIPK